jgi:hypothetical protein
MLEKAVMFSTRMFMPSAFLLFGLLPFTNAAYWLVNKLAVGVEAPSRDALPNWAPGEGILDKQE